MCVTSVISIVNELRQFLENGYSVLFMARKGSLEPFQRHYQHENIFQLFHRDGGKLTGKRSLAISTSNDYTFAVG